MASERVSECIECRISFTSCFQISTIDALFIISVSSGKDERSGNNISFVVTFDFSNRKVSPFSGLSDCFTWANVGAHVLIDVDGVVDIEADANFQIVVSGFNSI